MSALIEGFDTSVLNLGRHTPVTRKQREQALAGIAACEADFPGGNVRYGDALIGTDRHWRAGYEIRYHELLAAKSAAQEEMI